MGLESWFRALGSERSYLEKSILAVPSMLGPRCEKALYTSSTTPAIEHMKDQHQWNSDGPIPQPESTKLGISETRKRLDWAVIEANEVSRDLMKYRVL